MQGTWLMERPALKGRQSPCGTWVSLWCQVWWPLAPSCCLPAALSLGVGSWQVWFNSHGSLAVSLTRRQRVLSQGFWEGGGRRGNEAPPEACAPQVSLQNTFI